MYAIVNDYFQVFSIRGQFAGNPRHNLVILRLGVGCAPFGPAILCRAAPASWRFPGSDRRRLWRELSGSYGMDDGSAATIAIDTKTM